MSYDLQVFSDPQELAHAAAIQFCAHAKKATDQRGLFTVALSGGSTPKTLYALLVTDFRDRVPWQQTHFFWTDERHVPPDHPESNYHMVSSAMLSKAAVPGENVHRIRGELPVAEDAANEYEHALKHFFRLGPEAVPRFDLILLGLGTDGHTASLFPGSEALQEERRLTAGPWIERLQSFRITLTLSVLNNAAAILFLVSGVEKSEVLRQVLLSQASHERFPAQAVAPVNGELIWLVDSEAASLLNV